ncbi:MAG: O-antigen ligase family protein [Burkholderiaceae bacterium]|nr:O-antigen ligase family protein [Burkholderiaceae bacterium]
MHRFLWQGASLAAFLVPGLALWVPSGYSYGAAVMVLLSLASLGAWAGRPVPRQAWALAAAFAAMAAIWLLDVGAAWGWGSFDKPLKYLIALPCLFWVLAFAPRTAWLWAGLVVGACGSGLVALYQVLGLHWPRAAGYTNAIQYGNLSLLLALMCGGVLVVHWPCWSRARRGLWGLGLLLGAVGSLLSQSRGGWLALVIVLPLCAGLLARLGQRRAWWGVAWLALAALLLSQTPAVHERIQEAQHEVETYRAQGDGATSVGHRLSHWSLAWAMGRDRPWTGWGRAGYEAEKARRVAAGEAHPMVLQYGHAHNDALDLFAKRGLLGVLVLLLFYGVPLALFWPSRARVTDAQGQWDREALSLRLVGVLLPLSYASFGLTQAFLAHNSGNMFYLFMCLLVSGALWGRHPGAGPKAS